MNIRKNEGITLIALVITIVVLIILAGVSINLVLGENGLFTKAKDAAKNMDLASLKEQIQTEILAKQIGNQGNISDTGLKEILGKYGAIIYEEDGTTIKGIRTEKGYEILLIDLWNGTAIKIANEPDMSGFNAENTYYVTWKLNEEGTQYISKEIVMKAEDGKTNEAPNDWYDYIAGVNHWANIKTTGGENDCYWVWIPRYAYQVPNRLSNGETINIKFLEGTSNIPIGGTEEDEITNKTPDEGEWVVHPAFWWDNNNDGIENEGEQLTGIWVAKFEASSSAATDLTNLPAEEIETAIANDGGTENDTELKVRVKPNVTSWRNINVSDIFTVCKNITAEGNSLEGITNLDSHMMKNTEWGVVAYLSNSIYGINGDVWNNPYYNNTTNQSPITGLCKNKIENKDLSTTNISETCKYNEINGGNASTTGNVYGVYDMAGGAWEYVAAYLNEVTITQNFSILANAENKYKNNYIGTSTISTENYSLNTNQYGDAIYETSTGETSSSAWKSNYSEYLIAGAPILKRGGRAVSNDVAGVFAYINSTGGAGIFNAFRPCLINVKTN